MTRSLRSSLTLWFAALSAVLLAGFALMLLIGTYESRHEALDRTLRARAEALAALCEWEAEPGEFDIDLVESLPEIQGGIRGFRSFELRTWPAGELLHRLERKEAWRIPDELVARALRLEPRAEGSARRRFYDRESTEGEALRTCALLWRPPRAAIGILVLVTEDLDEVHEETGDLAADIALAAVLTLAAAVAAGWFLARRIARPMALLERTAAEVRAGTRADVQRSGAYREIDRLGAVLAEAFARLQEAYAQQARFTADASHELRTPLSVIRSSAEVALRRPREVAEYREALEEIAGGAERMGEVLQHLLLLARADTGGLELRETDVDLVALSDEVLAAARRDAATGDLELRREGAAAAELRGDAELLRILLTNLVSNAIRYSDGPGRVTVRIEASDAAVELSVQDEGIGIASADLPRLFDRFYRVDEHRGRQSGGSGLGLSIVQAIAERHGGSCAVESQPGQGTTVRVHFGGFGRSSAGSSGSGPNEERR